jgi:hypothetical protein
MGSLMFSNVRRSGRKRIEREELSGVGVRGKRLKLLTLKVDWFSD